MFEIKKLTVENANDLADFVYEARETEPETFFNKQIDKKQFINDTLEHFNDKIFQNNVCLLAYEGERVIGRIEYHFFKTVCDYGCGFGFYSMNLSKAGFEVSGFDIAQSSVDITKKVMYENNAVYKEIKQSSITKIDYSDNFFDAAFVNSIIDHLTVRNAELAVKEINRITKRGGLVYLSFDKLNDEDEKLPHDVMDDGSYLYSHGKRKGMVFHNYDRENIEALIRNKEILYLKTNRENIDVIYKNT